RGRQLSVREGGKLFVCVSERGVRVTFGLKRLVTGYVVCWAPELRPSRLRDHTHPACVYLCHAPLPRSPILPRTHTHTHTHTLTHTQTHTHTHTYSLSHTHTHTHTNTQTHTHT